MIVNIFKGEAMIKQGVNYTKIEKYVSQEEAARIRGELLTCPNISATLAGTISEFSENQAKSVFIPTAEMVVDEYGLIHDAFVFSAANYVAQAAINKEYSVLITSKSMFYAPLKLGDVLILEAQALFDDSSKKRDVKIVGSVNEIKVFESSMSLVVTDDHIFKLKRPPTSNPIKKDNDKDEKAENSDEAEAMKLLNAFGGL